MISQSLLRCMSIESAMPSNHLFLSPPPPAFHISSVFWKLKSVPRKEWPGRCQFCKPGGNNRERIYLGWKTESRDIIIVFKLCIDIRVKRGALLLCIAHDAKIKQMLKKKDFYSMPELPLGRTATHSLLDLEQWEACHSNQVTAAKGRIHCYPSLQVPGFAQSTSARSRCSIIVSHERNGKRLKWILSGIHCSSKTEGQGTHPLSNQ